MMLKPAAVADIDWKGGWKTYGELFSGKVSEVCMYVCTTAMVTVSSSN